MKIGTLSQIPEKITSVLKIIQNFEFLSIFWEILMIFWVLTAARALYPCHETKILQKYWKKAYNSVTIGLENWATLPNLETKTFCFFCFLKFFEIFIFFWIFLKILMIFGSWACRPCIPAKGPKMPKNLKKWFNSVANGPENWATFLTLLKKNFRHFGFIRFTENFDYSPLKTHLLVFRRGLRASLLCPSVRPSATFFTKFS